MEMNGINCHVFYFGGIDCVAKVEFTWRIPGKTGVESVRPLCNTQKQGIKVKPLYPGLGRPALNQQGLIQSLVLMLDQQEHSIRKWAPKIASDSLLFDLCGFDPDHAPAVNMHLDTWAKHKEFKLSDLLKEAAS